MRVRHAMRVAVGLAALWVVADAPAQGKQMTVAFLRAAASSLNNRDKVSVDAEYVAASGLRETRHSYMRGKGYSRFSIKDPEADVVYDHMYCEQDSKVFKTLIGLTEPKRYIFSGHRDIGEERKPAVFVTSIREHRARTPTASASSAISVAGASPPEQTYRISLIDPVTSNRTVLANVELNKPYNVLGTTLVLEAEPENAFKAPLILGE